MDGFLRGRKQQSLYLIFAMSVSLKSINFATYLYARMTPC